MATFLEDEHLPCVRDVSETNRHIADHHGRKGFIGNRFDDECNGNVDQCDDVLLHSVQHVQSNHGRVGDYGNQEILHEDTGGHGHVDDHDDEDQGQADGEVSNDDDVAEDEDKDVVVLANAEGQTHEHEVSIINNRHVPLSPNLSNELYCSTIESNLLEQLPGDWEGVSRFLLEVVQNTGVSITIYPGSLKCEAKGSLENVSKFNRLIEMVSVVMSTTEYDEESLKEFIISVANSGLLRESNLQEDEVGTSIDQLHKVDDDQEDADAIMSQPECNGIEILAVEENNVAEVLVHSSSPSILHVPRDQSDEINCHNEIVPSLTEEQIASEQLEENEEIGMGTSDTTLRHDLDGHMQDDVSMHVDNQVEHIDVLSLGDPNQYFQTLENRQVSLLKQNLNEPLLSHEVVDSVVDDEMMMQNTDATSSLQKTYDTSSNTSVWVDHVGEKKILVLEVDQDNEKMTYGVEVEPGLHGNQIELILKDNLPVSVFVRKKSNLLNAIDSSADVRKFLPVFPYYHAHRVPQLREHDYFTIVGKSPEEVEKSVPCGAVTSSHLHHPSNDVEVVNPLPGVTIMERGIADYFEAEPVESLASPIAPIWWGQVEQGCIVACHLVPMPLESADYFWDWSQTKYGMQEFPGGPKIGEVPFFLEVANDLIYEMPARRVPPSNYYLCYMCGFLGRIRERIILHVKAKHTARDWVCHVCKHTFGFERALRNHLKSHLNLRCPICNESIQAHTTSRHLRTHSCEEKISHGLIKCEHCEDFFLSRDALQSHKQSSHKMGRKRQAHLCPLCGKVFPRFGAVTSHMKTTHNNKVYSCFKCDRRFKQKNSVLYHWKTEHAESS